MINGNITGIRRSLLDEMEMMYESDMETLRHEFVSTELMDALAALSGRVNREISVYIARDGMVMDVSVGRHDRVGLPDLRVRRGARRLTGIRCIHTHPNASGELSSVDLATLMHARFDAMAAIGVVQGKAVDLYAAYLTGQAQPESEMYGPFDPLRPLPGKGFETSM